MNVRREQWQSHSGFVLATIGAAVGLGNIWRFSYVAGENGGGAFLLLYLIFVVIVGAPLVIAELALGRRAQGDAVAAFQQIAPRSLWIITGWLGVTGGFLILGYYAVIAGWALKYFAGAVVGRLWIEAAGGYGGYFKEFISHPAEPIGWQFAMLALTMFIVTGGVQRGIEMVNRILMPILSLIIIGLALYNLSLPDAAKGWLFLFAPDWAAFSRPEVYVAAMGQAFFSLGVGMAVFITYGSYMSRAFRIPVSAITIVAGDTLFAVIAGLAIFPAVFAFGFDPAAGPELAFITLPQIFLTMPGGTTIGTIFFLLLAAAALTSMVSLLEVPVAFFVHHLSFQRWTAVALVGSTIFIIGIPAALSFGVLSGIQISGRGVLDAMDHAVSAYLLPVGGLLTALFVGWRWNRHEALSEADLAISGGGAVWLWLLRIAVPAMVILILLQPTGPG